MRKIKAFSAQMSYSNDYVRKETTFSSSPRTQISTTPHGNIEVFMTPSLIKLSIREMKRPVAMRFLTLIKSARAYVKTNKKVEDLDYLKKFMVIQLTELLGAYVNMLATNASLQLSQYLKINSVCRSATDEARKLSRVMIQCNKIRKNTGILPPKNQRDLNVTMEAFINAVIDDVTSKSPINVANPMVGNPSLTEYNED